MDRDISLPEVLESDATGEIAEIYADIRATLGAPVVNLIWRHLATKPRELPLAWGLVKPLYASGAAKREAEAMRRAIDLPRLPVLPDALLKSVGISDNDQSRIRAVLASYDHTNAMALIALSALSIRLTGEVVGSESLLEADDLTRSSILPPLPKLLTLSQMEPATRELVVQLNMLGERDDGRIIATMYRHLAHWPPFLALAWALIAPADLDGRLRIIIATVLEEGLQRAIPLARRLNDPQSDTDPVLRNSIAGTIQEFVTHPIGKMTAICALLRDAIGAA